MSLISTKGVVLHTVKYAESSLISQIYTEKLGLQSYFVPGAFKKSSKLSANLFQSFSFLDMVVYSKGNKNMNKISQANILFSSIKYYNEPVKQAIAFFLSELLYQTLKYSHYEQKLFQFIEKSIKIFYEDNCKTFSFVHVFLIELTKYLGFYPDNCRGHFFDLKSGTFCAEMPNHHFFLNKEMTAIWYKLIQTNMDNYEQFEIKGQRGKELTEKLIDYLSLHIEYINKINSLDILRTIWV